MGGNGRFWGRDVDEICFVDIQEKPVFTGPIHCWFVDYLPLWGGIGQVFARVGGALPACWGAFGPMLARSGGGALHGLLGCILLA